MNRKRSRSPSVSVDEIDESVAKKRKFEQETVTDVWTRTTPLRLNQIQAFFDADMSFSMARFDAKTHQLTIKKSRFGPLYFIGSKIQELDQDQDNQDQDSKELKEVKKSKESKYKLSENPTDPYGYSGHEIGFASIDTSENGRLFYLIDNSGMKSNHRKIVAGIASFDHVRLIDDNKTFAVNLEFLAIHPIYQPVGNLGCTLLEGAEAWLVSEAKSKNLQSVFIGIPEAIFLNFTDDFVVQFYRKQGYIISSIQMGTVVLYKRINVEDYKQRDCTRMEFEYEIKGRDKTVGEMQKLLTESRMNLSTMNAAGERKSFRFPDKPTNAIPYLQTKRSLASLNKDVERVNRLLSRKHTINNDDKILLNQRKQVLEQKRNGLLDEKQVVILQKQYQQEYDEFEKREKKLDAAFEQERREFEITPTVGLTTDTNYKESSSSDQDQDL